MLPLLTRDFIDGALIGKSVSTLMRVVALFAGVTLASFFVNVISGLRYTRVSADILFDMRLELYRQATEKFLVRRNIVYLYHRNYIVAFPKNLKGYRAVPDGLIRLKGVSWN